MKRLSRRTWLKGAGAAVALPALEAMLDGNGTAFAQGMGLPRRFGVWFFGNGVRLPLWTPSATGAAWALTDELQPLASVKPYLNVVSGHKVKTNRPRGHGKGVSGVMSGIAYVDTPNANRSGGPTVDQIAAGTMGRSAVFPSLELGVSQKVDDANGPLLQCIAHKDSATPLLPELSPAAVYLRLFHAAAPLPPSDPTPRVKASVLDEVRDETKALQAKLGAADRARLDQHLTGISELRAQLLAAPPPAMCPKPMMTADAGQPDAMGNERLVAVNRLMADLLVYAWACDLNRVATFMFTGPGNFTVFSELGHTQGFHFLAHDQTQQGPVHDAIVFSMKQCAYFLEKLKATPEGAGNLLDNACVLVSSDVAEGLSHSVDDYPTVVAGRAGGYFKFPGVHYRGVDPLFGVNLSDLLFTCLTAVESGVASFGKDGGYSNKRVGAIVA